MGKAGKLQETWGSCWENADRCRKHFSICKQTNSPTPKSGQSGGKYQSHDLHQMKENRLPAAAAAAALTVFLSLCTLCCLCSLLQGRWTQVTALGSSEAFSFHNHHLKGDRPVSVFVFFLVISVSCLLHHFLSFFWFCFVFRSPFSSFPLQFYHFHLIFLS